MGNPTLPSAMHHFTAEFGMGSGGSNALMPPGKQFEKLATLPDLQSDNPFPGTVGEAAGFSLHAGVATKTNERATKSRRPQASWNDCADTSPGRQYPQSGYR